MSRTFEHDGCVCCKYEKEPSSIDYCQGCKQNAIDKYTRMTNADRIQQMGVDEFADFLLSLVCEEPSCIVGKSLCKFDYPEQDRDCEDCFKEWLESEVEE